MAATSVVGALSRFAPVMGSLKFAVNEDPSVAVQPLLIMLGYDSTSMDDIVAYVRYVATVLKWQATTAASVQVLLIEPRRLVAMTFPLLSLGGGNGVQVNTPSIHFFRRTCSIGRVKPM